MQFLYERYPQMYTYPCSFSLTGTHRCIPMYTDTHLKAYNVPSCALFSSAAQTHKEHLSLPHTHKYVDTTRSDKLTPSLFFFFPDKVLQTTTPIIMAGQRTAFTSVGVMRQPRQTSSCSLEGYHNEPRSRHPACSP